VPVGGVEKCGGTGAKVPFGLVTGLAVDAEGDLWVLEGHGTDKHVDEFKKKVSVKRHGKTVKVMKKVEEQVAAPLEMPTEIIGQNGAEVHEQTKISVEGCPKARPAKKAKHGHRRKK
jgi:hypothetical protein